MRQSVGDYIDDFDGSAPQMLPRLRAYVADQAAKGQTDEIDTVQVASPVCAPGQIICVGMNYIDHRPQVINHRMAGHSIAIKSARTIPGSTDPLRRSPRSAQPAARGQMPGRLGLRHAAT
jgi:2-keto-4-pentenoate hydratase/2-oxohepta-3-ene-1,7-dioic acid hydratase in catechol pathway